MPPEAAYRVCPQCREEYRLVASRCADCDVGLVDPATLDEEAAAVEEFPPAAELSCVRVAPLAWIRALSEALTSRGVAHRVEPGGSEDAPEDQRPAVFGDAELFGLYVREADAEAARELDSRIAAQLLPEEAPVLAEGDEDACPACGAALALDATACSDCGIDFGPA